MSWFKNKKTEMKENYQIHYLIMYRLFEFFALYTQFTEHKTESTDIDVLIKNDENNRQIVYALRNAFFARRPHEIEKIINETIAEHKGAYLNFESPSHVDNELFNSFLDKFCAPLPNPLNKEKFISFSELGFKLWKR